MAVDLLVRTFAGDTLPLQMLLRSVAVFWPPEWGVVVILDGDSAEDSELSLVLARTCHRCRVEFEPAPPFLSRWAPAPRGHGYLRAQWGAFHYDAYSKADFVAHMDADAVLASFGQPQLLFEAEDPLRSSPRELLPFVHGHAGRPIFPEGVAVVGLEWVAEFMDALPFILRREDLPALRAFISARLLGAQAADFAEAFLVLQTRTLAACGEAEPRPEHAGCLPCFQTIAGHFLFHARRSRYAWAILDPPTFSTWNALIGLPLADVHGLRPQDTCPALRAGVHVPYHGIDHVWIDAPALKRGRSYAKRAASFVRVGICAAWEARRAAALVRPAGSGRGQGQTVRPSQLPPMIACGAGRATLPLSPFLEPEAWRVRRALTHGTPPSSEAVVFSRLLLPPSSVLPNSSFEGLLVALGCGDRQCWFQLNTSGCPRGRRWTDLRRRLVRALATEDLLEALDTTAFP